MFGIGSLKKSQEEMLEEEYRIKYLKYKEKYLKLKQSGGFGKTSSGIHCFLTTKQLANEVKDSLASLDLNGITDKLHDQAYVVKDGDKEVVLVQKTSLSELGAKLKFWGEKPKPVPLKNAEKVTDNTEVMNRCNDESIQKIRKAIKEANILQKKITYKDVVNKIRDTEKSTASHLTHMIVINIAAIGKNHKLIGDIKKVSKKPEKPSSDD